MANNYVEQEPDLPGQSTIEVYSTTDERKKLDNNTSLCYIIYASLLWITICIVIYSLHQSKKKLLSHDTSWCCKCFNIANEPSYTGPQLEFSHCLDDGCSCNLCNDQYNKYLNESNNENIECRNLTQFNISATIPTKYPQHPKRDKGCYSHLSTTSLYIFPKSYDIYGILGCAISISHVLLLWIYFACCRNFDIGISIFIHSVINGEIVYFAMIKSYQFQLNEDTNCFESIMTMEQTKIFDIGIPVILIQIIFQWLYVWTIRCFAKGRIGKNIYVYWGNLITIVSILCILFSFILYIWVSVMIYSHERIIDEKSSIGPLIVVSICILVVIFSIFVFPFCWNSTAKLCKLWKWRCMTYRKYKCWKISRLNPSKRKFFKTYASGLGWEEEARQKLLQEQDSGIILEDVDEEEELYPM